MPIKSIACLMLFIPISCFSSAAYADTTACPLDLPIENFTEKDCRSIDSVNIATYVGEKPNAYSEENERPTLVIAYSQNAANLLKISGAVNQTKFRTKLVEPPFSFMIEERHALSKIGYKPLKKTGWKMHAEVIGYRGKEEETGPDVLCVTAIQLNQKNNLAISTCSSFYDDEIKNFKSILDLLSATFCMPH